MRICPPFLGAIVSIAVERPNAVYDNTTAARDGHRWWPCLLLTYFSQRVRTCACEALPRACPNAVCAARGRVSAAGRAYLLLTYFSRRICGTGKPWVFSTSKQASTMFGLPQR
jgi:hypothetical protein